MRKTILASLFALVFASVAWAQDKASQKMIHIDFKDDRPDGVELVMSLPISVLTTFQPQIREAFMALEEENDSLNFVEIWNSVKDVGPHDFMEIKGKDGHIKISTTESHFVARVNSPEMGDIEALVPLALGDILFANSQNVDLEGIVAALGALEGQDLVRIRSEFINGRVWID